MDAPTLLDSLQHRGAVLTIDGPTLFVEPAHMLTDSDCAAIRELKPALIELLAPAPSSPEQATSAPLEVFYPRDYYDPAESRAYALTLPHGTVRDYLLKCADEAEGVTNNERNN